MGARQDSGTRRGHVFLWVHYAHSSVIPESGRRREPARRGMLAARGNLGAVSITHSHAIGVGVTFEVAQPRSDVVVT